MYSVRLGRVWEKGGLIHVMLLLVFRMNPRAENNMTFPQQCSWGCDAMLLH